MATENTLIEAANNIFITVPGIKRVFLYAKNTGPSADLPCVIKTKTRIVPGRKTRELQFKDYYITFLLLVAPYNRPLESLDKQGRPFGDLVLDAFFIYPNLNFSTEIIEEAEMIEANYGQITYNEAEEYLGWEFTLKARITQVLNGGDLAK
jgi:hypothetical protein